MYSEELYNKLREETNAECPFHGTRVNTIDLLDEIDACHSKMFITNLFLASFSNDLTEISNEQKEILLMLDVIKENVDKIKEQRDNFIQMIKRTLDYGDELVGSGKFEGISYPLANWNGNAKRIRKYLKKLDIQ